MGVTELRYEIVRHLGLPHLLRRYHRSHALVLCYHGVVPQAASPPRWTELTAARFRTQMAALRSRYRLIPLLEIVERVRRGAPLPAYAAAVTFDDGYRNNYTHAFPVLEELGIPATIFLTTGFLDDRRPLWTDRLTLALSRASTIEAAGRVLPLGTPAQRQHARAVVAAHLKALPAPEKNRQLAALEGQGGAQTADIPDALQPLAWDEVRAMQASGLVDFGSHTVRHEIMSRLDAATKAHEITRSCARVEQETGRPCRLFAYPNGEPGDIDAESQALLRQTRVLGAMSTVPGLVGRAADVWALPRVLVGADAGPAKFDVLSSGLLAAVTGARRPGRGGARGAA